MRNLEIRQQIGERLLEERQRLRLSQQALADLIGGVRLSIVKYESGRSSPAAETLAAMEAIGIDVRYVLTGFRTSPSGIDRERFKVAFAEVLGNGSACAEGATSQRTQTWVSSTITAARSTRHPVPQAPTDHR